MGYYFPDIDSGTTLSPAMASAKFDEYNWVYGWRAQDTPEQTIWLGGCPDCLFQELGLYFVMETRRMRVTKITRLGTDDILAEIERIDSETP